jgi:large subunit ribosomal protein L32
MAVPKTKKSKMRKRMRIAHTMKANLSQVKPCPNCGAPHRSHRACPSCGHYRGRQVLGIEVA